LRRRLRIRHRPVFLRIAAVITFPVSDAATMLHLRLGLRWKQ
jgi:hypothetical protein